MLKKCIRRIKKEREEKTISGKFTRSYTTAITRKQQKTRNNFFEFLCSSKFEKKSITENKSMNARKNTVDSVRVPLFHQIIYKCRPLRVWKGGNESTEYENTT